MTARLSKCLFRQLRRSTPGLVDFEWTPALEEEWTRKHGRLAGPVAEVDKAEVFRLFENRTLQQKLLESLVMLDVRSRQEVVATARLDVDVDQVYVVPFDELDDALQNLNLQKWYQKYVFPKPRKTDTIIVYGKDENDIRPVLAARLLTERFGYENVQVYKAGFVDFRQMDYPEWVEVRESKIASLKTEAQQERTRLEARRKEELERYRRERARRSGPA
ncbi:hypothetical protein DIPPA_22520 [Diplonema papillatum]|nr:hypothetical protein DIPPA_22520 [Diplonema papillatum]